MIKIYNGDCLEVMEQLKENSIDCIICDLPFGTTQNKWDNIIPFAPMWKCLQRLIKDNGAIVLFGQEPFSSVLRMSNTKLYKYDWIWEKSKSTNFLNAKKQPLRKTENISVFYKKQPYYCPQMAEGKPYDKGVRKNQLTGSYGIFNPVHVKSDGLRYPTNIIYFKTAEAEGEVLHPTQKPLRLLEYLIKTYTKEGDLVLDFCMGSGTTGVACKNLNRHFIGIELEEKYFKIAEKRIND